MSSASAHSSTLATAAPSAMEYAASFAGFRNATTTCSAFGYSAMGKLPPSPIGHLATSFRSRSTTTDRLVRRIVHENPLVGLIELERLGMCVEIDLGDSASTGCIEDRQSAMAMCHKHFVRDRIHTDVVRILAHGDSRHRCVIIAAEDRHRSVTAAGDIQSIGRGMVVQSLRLAPT